MTQDEIIEMARQTGWHDALLDVSFVLPTLTDFAKLVATKVIAELEQRTWVGLTDDEFNELYDRYVPLTCYALLIEKVEAKLKQKNGYAEEENT
jgi:hypothetical protein